MSDIAIGQVLVGKYRVERVLGQGGMGVVVEALHLQLAQRVAIKFVLPEALHNPEVRGRFLREAQAAARLKSAHVARVIDVGTLESGSPFIVMELLEGEDLASILRRHGPLPFSTAAAWILEACEAIAEAHGLGIIHRDLKPANLFLARGAGQFEIVKVFDFGISKVPVGGGLELSLTRTTSVMGSPGYASPEQLRATRSVDHRADIWALGVTLYQLVSGNVPWTADTLPELSIKIAVDPAPPLPPHLGVPAAFERIISRCLEKDPGLRFPSVAALAEVLGPFAPNGRDAVERVRRAYHVAGGPLTPTTAPSSAGEVAEQARGRARAYGIVGGLVLAAGVAAAAIVAASGQGKATPPPVVAGTPDAAAVVVATPPDARPLAVTAIADAAPASTVDPRPEEDRYATLVKEADRRARGSCAHAVRFYESAIDIRPRGHEALAGLAGCLLTLKDYDRAISNFRAALAVSPRDPETLIGAAEAYQHKGRVPEAIDHYQRYLKVEPRGDRAARARRNLEILKRGGQSSDEELFGTGKGSK